MCRRPSWRSPWGSGQGETHAGLPLIPARGWAVGRPGGEGRIRCHHGPVYRVFPQGAVVVRGRDIVAAGPAAEVEVATCPTGNRCHREAGHAWFHLTHMTSVLGHNMSVDGRGFAGSRSAGPVTRVHYIVSDVNCVDIRAGDHGRRGGGEGPGVPDGWTRKKRVRCVERAGLMRRQAGAID